MSNRTLENYIEPSVKEGIHDAVSKVQAGKAVSKRVSLFYVGDMLQDLLRRPQDLQVCTLLLYMWEKTKGNR